MEGGFIHCQKKCSKLTWCYFNVKGFFLIQIPQAISPFVITVVHAVIYFLQGPPMETSIDSLSAKRKKGQKNKRSNQRRSMGELLVLPFLSKFPIPSVSNVSQKKVLNE
jgi:hypothetical protein